MIIREHFERNFKNTLSFAEILHYRIARKDGFCKRIRGVLREKEGFFVKFTLRLQLLLLIVNITHGKEKYTLGETEKYSGKMYKTNE